MRLQQRKEAGTLRVLRKEEGLIDLTSNDYFGFARGMQGLSACSGATGSRLLTGNDALYEALEEKIAQFHGAESCLIYNTGYMANLGLISALGTEEVTLVYDLEIHASMIDGIRLSRAKKRAFFHNDLDSLERQLKKGAAATFVLVESLYSMSGDQAPLKEIAALCSHYGACLIVDEAHATGVFGPRGAGCVCALGLESQVFARVHTFSKALGSHGACVLGSSELKEYLINFSRPLIYTTALPRSVLCWIEAGYERLCQEAETHQSRLNALIHYFQQKSHSQSVDGPIQPLYIPGIEAVRSLSHQLKLQGLDVRAVIPPTIRRGKECLRVVLHSFNREEEIDRLMEIVQ